MCVSPPPSQTRQGDLSLFRKGKIVTKIAIKIPFFVEVEVNFETDWTRRREAPLLVRPGASQVSAPRFGPAGPGPRQTFDDKHVAKTITVADENSKLSTVTVFIAPWPGL